MKPKQIVLIDNFDSFTFNLVDYLKQCGAQVTVFRNTVPVSTVSAAKPDVLIYSPGPGNPSQSGNLLAYIKHFSGKVPEFGVCLGLQAIIESFGGTLQVLDHPKHGKASPVQHDGKTIFTGLVNPMTAGRYHSLAADRVPVDFVISARSTDDDVVMAIRHNTLPIEAVQFHPESILTAKQGAGLQLIRNVLKYL